MKPSLFLVGTLVWAIAPCGCVGRRVGPPEPPTEDLTLALERFRAFSLAPARLPPPSVDPGWQAMTVDGISARARLVTPEEGGWNTWPGDELRLFNDRWAWLAEVEVEGPKGLLWDPSRTVLELNDDRHALTAAARADDLLGDLLFWALQQERTALGDDLVARTRAAGGFREAYLGPTEQGLGGIIAFPAGEHDGLHVVAARLTLGVVVDGARRELVWVFQ